MKNILKKLGETLCISVSVIEGLSYISFHSYDSIVSPNVKVKSTTNQVTSDSESSNLGQTTF